tara:strand:- start:110900 stop:111976 length:1077 start_codon:yes stop_codon:yes gene_type:complete
MTRILIASILISMIAVALRADELYFPGDTWDTVAPADVNWNGRKIDRAIDFAMKRRSSSVVILHGGKIMAERHSEVKDASPRYRFGVTGKSAAGHVIEDVASAQKSVVSFLVGIAIDKGLIAIDDPVDKHLGTGWSRATETQESAITVRHLISMTSGLDEKLQYTEPPGSKWMYNSSAYAKSLSCLEAASGLTANELTSQWLLQKVQMNDSRWTTRQFAKLVNKEANANGFATTARDLARFGLLVQAQGKWKDSVVLADKAYLKDSISPSQKLKPSYGYLWWLNDQAVVDRTGKRAARPMIPTAPADLVAAKGALGRKCYVVPSLNLVVTRLGDDPNAPGRKNFDTEFWRLLMESQVQ